VPSERGTPQGYAATTLQCVPLQDGAKALEPCLRKISYVIRLLGACNLSKNHRPGACATDLHLSEQVPCGCCRRLLGSLATYTHATKRGCCESSSIARLATGPRVSRRATPSRP
ncbi:unnamed protein product, partial [Scytosiphon promiscuus]